MAYKSKGTVRVESIIGNWSLFFVPDNNHSVKYENTDCAVFFNTGGNQFDRGRIVELDANGRGVKVILGNTFQGNTFQRNSPAIQLLSSAVARQIKVEIKVDIPHGAQDAGGNVTLADIALPVK